MTYPAFLYLMTVQVHTPTASMYFHQCDSWGKVKQYRHEDIFSDSSPYEYEVEFECGYGRKIRDWLREANLRRAMRK